MILAHLSSDTRKFLLIELEDIVNHCDLSEDVFNEIANLCYLIGKKKEVMLVLPTGE